MSIRSPLSRLWNWYPSPSDASHKLNRRPELELLEDRVVPAATNFVAVGADAGSESHVRVFDADSQQVVYDLFPFPGFTGGVRVALGDVNGDSTKDIITGAGPGGGPHVKVYDGTDGTTVLHSFFAYGAAFTGGVYVGATDSNGDGKADIITGPGPGGGPNIQVFDGKDLTILVSTFAYDDRFRGGVTVAGGDVNGDGFGDIITGPGPGGGSDVRVFEGNTGVWPETIVRFLVFDGFTGGIFVAGGDINDNGFDDLIVGAGAGGGPHVRIFDGGWAGELASFFAFDASFTGGVRVASNVNRVGPDDVIVAMGPGGDQVKIFNGNTAFNLSSFNAYGDFGGGVNPASGDINNDGFYDIVTGADSGGGPHVKVFDGKTGSEIQSFFPYGQGFTGGVRVATGDINHDGFADIITGAGPGGGPHVRVLDGKTGAELFSVFAYPGFTGGVFVAGGDVNGDGVDDIITGAGPGGGPHVKVYDGRTKAEIASFFAFDARFSGGVTVSAGDINNDGKAEILVAPSAVGGAAVGTTTKVFRFDGPYSIVEIRSFSAYSPGLQLGVYLASADLNGDGFAEIITGAGQGGGPHVKIFDGATGNLTDQYFATDLGSNRGVRVAAGDRKSDGFVDIINAAGAGGPPLVRLRVDRFFAFGGFGGGVFV